MPSLFEQPLHLGPEGAVTVEPVFDSPGWYEGYDARHGADGIEGRLVSRYAFHASWDSWEMHPAGDEVVLCIAGTLTLIQEYPDGRIERTVLGAGEYAINPPGVWHTADLAEGETADCVFITTGMGTEHRGR
ncbi:cupin domain-containing protein [Sphingomonas sp. FW199]|uniref:cupin domain-containing protein n=1 Tax=Sphingomonas sp. FW199 TaxID=3400217 RepID=UPI003CEC5235